RQFGYVETLTMAPMSIDVINGRLMGDDAITTGNLRTLSRTYFNNAGQSVRTDAYFSMAGMTYNLLPNVGTQNANYYTTLYAFDNSGRQNQTITPNGTIYLQTFDGLGRV